MKTSLTSLRAMRPQHYLALAVAACFSSGAWALPTGAQVVAGQATITKNGSTLTVTNTPGAIINWQNFSVGAMETARFIQQNAASSVLNRVVGPNASQILGALQSNGKVWLINPNGILFGPNARVDVAGLVASTLAINDQDFRAGRLKFNAEGTAGTLRNQGQINAAGGGVYLVAPDIENAGIIHAPGGEVLLAAGRKVELVEAGHPDVQYVFSAPDDKAVNLGQILVEGGRAGLFGALLEQRGLISANSASLDDAGRIVFRASRETLVSGGQITATSAAGRGGQVELTGDKVSVTGDAAIDVSGNTGGGSVLVGGDYQGKNTTVPNARETGFAATASVRADATGNGDGGKVIFWANDTTRAAGTVSARGGALGGNGGLVETSGHKQVDFSGFRVDTRAPKGNTGLWLIDPQNLDIDSTGAANIGTALVSSSVNVTTSTCNPSYGTCSGTDGDIAVNANISWASGNTLTLDADRDIAVNANISGGAAGLLYLNSGRDISLNSTAALTASSITFLAPGGNITQAAGTAITTSGANGLSITAKDVDLTLGSNNVNFIRGSIVNGGGDPGNFKFKSSSALEVAGTGISIDLGVYSYTAPDNKGIIYLEAPSITQAAGAPLEGAAVVAKATAGAVLLDTEPNDTGVIAGSSTGAFNYKSANTILLTSINGEQGITAGGPVTLESTGGNITASQTYSSALINGASATLTADGDISLPNANVLSSLSATSASGDIAYRGSALSNGSNAISAPAGKVFLLVPSLSLGSTSTITAGQHVRIVTDAFDLGGLGTITASGNPVQITPKSSGKNVEVATSTSACAGGALCLASGDLTTARINADELILGSPAGENDAWGNASVPAAVDVTISNSINRTIGKLFLLGSGNVSQGSSKTIYATYLGAKGASVALDDLTNSIDYFAGTGTTGGVSVASDSALEIKTISSSLGHSITGINAATTAGVTADGNLVITAPVVASSSDVTLASTGGAVAVTGAVSSGDEVSITSQNDITGTGSISGTSVYLESTSGSVGPVNTQTAILSAKALNNIEITNTGAVTIQYCPGSNCYGFKAANGDITFTNTGAITTGNSGVYPHGGAFIAYGNIDVTANSPLTVGTAGISSSMGNVTLTAGSPDNLTLTGTVSAGGGTITLNATGGTVVGASSFAPSAIINQSSGGGGGGGGGAVTPPTLDACVATPSLAGCSSVLPTLDACTAAPSTAGCIAVLPTLDTCTAAPATAGCTVVLPALATCTATPTAAGCTAVLPTLATCTSAPTTAGCSAVLPTLATCITTPAAAGCAAILPTLDACTSAPSTAGCAAVLPTLATCTATPTAAGCTAVLPTSNLTPGEQLACLTQPEGCVGGGSGALTETVETLYLNEQTVALYLLVDSTMPFDVQIGGGSGGGAGAGSGDSNDTTPGKKSASGEPSGQQISKGETRNAVGFCN